jgi:hypothetical protein
MSRFDAILEFAGELAVKAPLCNGTVPTIVAAIGRRDGGITLEARLSDEQRYLLELDGVSPEAGQASLRYLTDRLACCGVAVVAK